MRGGLGVTDTTEHHPQARTGLADGDRRPEPAIDRRNAAVRRSDAARPRDAGPPRGAARCVSGSPGRARARSPAAAERLSAGRPLRSSRLRAVWPGVESLGERVDDRYQVIEL